MSSGTDSPKPVLAVNPALPIFGGAEMAIPAPQAAELLLKSGHVPKSAINDEADLVGQIHELQVNQVALKMQNDELREARTGLEDSLRLCTELYDFAPVAFFAFDALGIIRKINLAGARLLGLDRSAATGRSFANLVKVDSREDFERLLASAVSGTGTRSCDIDLLPRYPSVGRVCIHIEVECVNKDGGILAIAVDLSERMRTSAELDHHRRSLEKLVFQRSGEIEALNHELEQRVLEAQAGSRAKSTFLANMSHELRTPMNAILGLTSLMFRECPEGSGLERKLSLVRDAGNQLLTLIDDVLELSRIEAGKIDMEYGEFSIQTMFDDLNAIAATRLRAKGLRFTTNLVSLPNAVIGDEVHLSRILLNFLNNAIKFTEQGAVALRGTLLEETPDDLLVRFAVEDTGIGITDEQMRRLFIAFEQADTSSTRRHGGAGLGLALCRQLAHRMGGAVGAQSRQGGGSIFWLDVRLVKVDDVPD